MNSRIRMALASLVLLMASSCSSSQSTKNSQDLLPEAQAADVLVNRNWMDLWPATESEKLHVFRFVPSMGGGVYQDRTLFKGTFELFTFKVDGGEIRFDLHHKKQKVSSPYRIERVSGPEPFDLKLTIESSPRGPNVYFGRSAEVASDLGLHPIL